MSPETLQLRQALANVLACLETEFELHQIERKANGKPTYAIQGLHAWNEGKDALQSCLAATPAGPSEREAFQCPSCGAAIKAPAPTDKESK